MPHCFHKPLSQELTAQAHGRPQHTHLVVPAAHTELATHAVAGRAVVYAHTVLGRQAAPIRSRPPTHDLTSYHLEER